MTSDLAAEMAHLEQLSNTLRRRLRVLETQRARYGDLAVPAHIVLELEDIARDLSKAQAELRRVRPAGFVTQEPYRGLLTFDESDAEHFFGRDTLVAELVERAGRTSFLTVLGASGSGKSSIVRAGLVPVLKGGALPDSEHWQYITLRPEDSPIDALAAELAKLQGGSLDLTLRLSRELAESNRALLLATKALVDRTSGQRLVLVVDQAEELWTQTPPDQRDRFVDMLLTGAEAPAMPTLIILTMRADFLHRALERRPLAEQIKRNITLVEPMDRAELHAVIARPAEAAGGSFEPGLVDELIEQTAGRSGALPLLEYTLQELWRQRSSEGTMTWEALQALGGVEGGIARTADAIMSERYTPEQREELRTVLLRLVQPGEGAADTRRRSRLEDLATQDQSIESVQMLLAPLVNARLLAITTGGRPPMTEGTDRPTASADIFTEATMLSSSVSRPPSDSRQPSSIIHRPPSAWVEIAHEALIRAWPMLSDWISEARADLLQQIKLEEAVRDWQANDENRDYLWAGLPLANAEDWVSRGRPRLTTHERQFLEASRRLEQERLAAVAEREFERERLRAEVAERERERERLRAELSDNLRRQEQEYAAITKRELDLTKRARRRLQLAVTLLSVLLFLSVGAGVIFARGEIRRLQAIRGVLLVTLPGRAVAFERYEVTNQRYNLCVQAGACRQPSNNWYASAADASLPVTHVNYYDAAQFCSWIGRRLPTRDEWEYAATSGGSMELPQREDMFNLWRRDAPDPATKPAAVGSFSSATSEGVFDLIGNVWEWTSTEALSADGAAAATSPGVEAMNGYVAGGSFATTVEGIQSQQGIWELDRSTVLNDIGFRCVVDVP